MGLRCSAAMRSWRGLRLGCLVMHAELEAVICSGPLRGKQFTYALFEERVPPAPPKVRGEALAELAVRYFRAHGPATVHDYSWWSGLTMGDCRAGVAASGDAVFSVEHDGKRYWMASEIADLPESCGVVHVLPVYDEHIVAYRDHGPSIHPALIGAVKPEDDVLNFNIVALGGLVIGGWRRTIKAREIVIETDLLLSLNTAVRESLEAAAGQYGQFHGLPVSIVERTVDRS